MQILAAYDGGRLAIELPACSTVCNVIQIFASTAFRRGAINYPGFKTRQGEGISEGGEMGVAEHDLKSSVVLIAHRGN